MARTLGVTPPAVSRWVKKGGAAHCPDCAGRRPDAVIAYAEMWTYQPARHGEQRPDLWIGMAAVAEPAGRREADFEVGDHSENTFQRRYAGLPAAKLYRSDAYGVYGSWLPPGRHAAGKDGAVNRKIPLALSGGRC